MIKTNQLKKCGRCWQQTNHMITFIYIRIIITIKNNLRVYDFMGTTLQKEIFNKNNNLKPKIFVSYDFMVGQM